MSEENMSSRIHKIETVNRRSGGLFSHEILPAEK
jgi:hypothetical protein